MQCRLDSTTFIPYEGLNRLNIKCCFCSEFCWALLTSWDETNGAEQTRLCVVHLDGQQLVGKREHQVSERAEARVVHLSPVQGQSIWKSHGVLVRSVPGTDTQDLMDRKGRDRLSAENYKYLFNSVPTDSGNSSLLSADFSAPTHLTGDLVLVDPLLQLRGFYARTHLIRMNE